jgi:hypothetical protein
MDGKQLITLRYFLQSEPTPNYNHEVLLLDFCYILQHNIPLYFHTQEVLYLFYSVYNTFPRTVFCTIKG